MAKAAIYRFEPDVQEDIMSQIHALLQVRDFHMFNPVDMHGNSVYDLYIHWMATGLERMWLRTFIPHHVIAPPLEVQLTMENLLREYDESLYRQISIPADFPSGFTIDHINNTTIVLDWVLHAVLQGVQHGEPSPGRINHRIQSNSTGTTGRTAVNGAFPWKEHNREGR